MSASTLNQQSDLIFTFVGGQRHGQLISIQTEQCLLALGDHDGADDQPLCAIYRSIDGVAIRNLDEQTLVNGKPKTTHWLKRGDQIQFSNSATLEVTNLGFLSQTADRTNVSVCSPVDFANNAAAEIQPADKNFESRLELLSDRLDRLSDQVLTLIDLVCSNEHAPQHVTSPDLKRLSAPSASTVVDEPNIEMASLISESHEGESSVEYDSREANQGHSDSFQTADFQLGSFSAESFGLSESDVQSPHTEDWPGIESIPSDEVRADASTTGSDEDDDSSGNSNFPQFSTISHGRISDFEEDKTAADAAIKSATKGDDSDLQVNLAGETYFDSHESVVANNSDANLDQFASFSGSRLADPEHVTMPNLAASNSNELETEGSTSDDIANILARLKDEIDWSENFDSPSGQAEIEQNANILPPASEPPDDSNVFVESSADSVASLAGFQESTGSTIDDSMESELPSGISEICNTLMAADSDQPDSLATKDEAAPMDNGGDIAAQSEPESVEEYMNRLLERMNCSKIDQSQTTSNSLQTSDPDGTPITGMESSRVESQNESICSSESDQGQSPSDESFMPRKKLEKPFSLDAMRDLANNTTRSAIAQSQLNRRQTRGLMMAIFSGGATLISIYYLLFVSKFVGDMSFWLGCLGLLSAIVMAVASLVILKVIQMQLPKGLLLHSETESSASGSDTPPDKD